MRRSRQLAALSVVFNCGGVYAQLMLPMRAKICRHGAPKSGGVECNAPSTTGLAGARHQGQNMLNDSKVGSLISRMLKELFTGYSSLSMRSIHDAMISHISLCKCRARPSPRRWRVFMRWLALLTAAMTHHQSDSAECPSGLRPDFVGRSTVCRAHASGAWCPSERYSALQRGSV